MQVQELVGIVPWNFIATICNLFIQVYLIKRFLFKPINEMLEKRKAKADAQIQDAVKAKEEAQAMKAEYEKNMQEAKNKANDIVMTAQKTAAIQSEEMLKEASSQVTAMKEKAEKDMDCDGTKAGYDLALTRAIADAVSIPVIASGGAGTLEHFYDALTEAGADAALAASLFHYKELEISQVKDYLSDRGISVRR